MILQCPQCSTRFLVADALIPAAGRTVKCGSCKHDWHVTPADNAPADAPVQAASFAAAVEEEIASSAEDSAATATVPTPNVPAVVASRGIPVRPLQIAAPLIALSWFLVALYGNFYAWQHWPVIGGLYGMLGVVETGGLRFDKVEMEKQKEGQRTRFLLTGAVVNESTEARTIPSVRVRLIGKDGAEVWSREYEVKKTVKAGDEYPFRITNVETSFGHQVAQVVMDVGNPMQLSFR